MSSDTSSALARIFYATNERLGPVIEVKHMGASKKKTQYLVFTISNQKPTIITVYLMKSLENKSEFKKKSVSEHSQISKLDLKETHPYDFDLHTNMNKIWHFTTIKWEHKLKFITALCLVIGNLVPNTLQNIAIMNAPKDFNISSPERFKSIEDILDYCDFDNKMSVNTAGDSQELKDSSQMYKASYSSLSAKEDADINRFMNEQGIDALLDPSSFIEQLEKISSDAEGNNVRSIMESDNQVQNLMANLNQALDHLNAMEGKIKKYYSYLSSLEDSMSSLRDRDQLVQMTSGNRFKLLQVLEHLVDRLCIDPMVVNLVQNQSSTISSQAELEMYFRAANEFDRIMEYEPLEGEVYMSAYEKEMTQMNSLKGDFSAKIAHQFNSHILKLVNQITCTLNSGMNIAQSTVSLSSLDSSHTSASGLDLSHDIKFPQSLLVVDELLKMHRPDLIALSPFVYPWMESHEKATYESLKAHYRDKLAPVKHKIIFEIFKAALEHVAALTGGKKASQLMLKTEQYLDETGLTIFMPSEGQLTQFKKIFEIMLHKLDSLILDERMFAKELFGLNFFRDKHVKKRDTVIFFIGNMFPNFLSDFCQFISACEQFSATYAFAMLAVMEKYVEQQLQRDARDWSIQLEERAQQQQVKRQSSLDHHAEETTNASTVNTSSNELTPADASFLTYTYNMIKVEIKAVCDRQVEAMLRAFNEAKPSKRSRCGILGLVRLYQQFALGTVFLLHSSSPGSGIGGQKRCQYQVELENSHRVLIENIFSCLTSLASSCQKTPTEVVLIENYHLLFDIISRLRLDEFKKEAKRRHTEAVQLFTGKYLGHPLPNLTQFFNEIQRALAEGVRADLIIFQTGFSKQRLMQVIKEYPLREVRKGLEQLRKKIEKHLNPEENLFIIVWRAMQEAFLQQCLSYKNLIEMCYPDSGIALEFNTNDVEKFFVELAQSG